jgi:endonuclease YncB( thermonuclease family)
MTVSSVSSKVGSVKILMLGALVAIAAGAWSPVQAQEITGPGNVIDSDDIEVAGKRVMLYGLESVQRQQTCTINGEMWECWPAAVRQLETLVSLGDVTCTPVGQPDIYGRVLARCEVAGESLNEQLVRSGFAVARRDETDEYVAAEEAAQREKIGLWRGEFMTPWDFRTSRGIMVDRP